MMDWSGLLGHDRQRQWFQHAVQQGRLASTFLFVGPSGIGKRTFAHLIAKSLLCTTRPPEAFSPCGHCEACMQVAAGTHPDVIAIQRDEDKSTLSIDQFVGDKDARMQEGLCYELRLKPYSGRRRIAIVDDADTLAAEGANSLLKTLEEPPPGSLIFLIGTSEQRQLRTIRSRSQIVRFHPLSETQLATLILRQGWAQNEQEALQIASESDGSMDLAKLSIEESWRALRQHLNAELRRCPIDFPKLGKTLIDHVNDAGTEGQARREQLKSILDCAIDVYRNALRESLGVRGENREALHPTSRLSEQLDAPTLVSLIQRTQTVRDCVDRNISPAALIETWVADVASLSRA